MSTLTARHCSHPGCPALVPSGRCARHRAVAQQHYDHARGTSTQRGYGVRWRRYRERFLAAYGRCGDRPSSAPLTRDSRCRLEGRTLMPASVVDHIVPITGADDPRFYDERNHQALCGSCHDAKRQREAMAGKVRA